MASVSHVTDTPPCHFGWSHINRNMHEQTRREMVLVVKRNIYKQKKTSRYHAETNLAKTPETDIWPL